jgi:SRSO17 transposase
LQVWDLQIDLVLADSLYGESGDVIRMLERLNLRFIVATRSNHGVLVAPGQNCVTTVGELTFNHSPTGDLKHAISGKLSLVKSEQFVQYEISKTESPTTEPLETWFIMTNLPKSWQLKLGGQYFEVGLNMDLSK